MKKTVLLLLVFMSFWAVQVNAQWSITAVDTDFTIDFDNTVAGVNEGVFAGTGFAITPGAGQLDADGWAISGMSELAGLKDFGVEATAAGDYARGTSSGGVTTGGLYAFEVEAGNYALGVQPSANDFTPGYIAFKVTNNTGATVNYDSFSYDVWVRNDGAFSSSFNGEFSLDGATWFPAPEFAFSTPEAADGAPVWVKTTLSYDGPLGFDLLDGQTIYFRINSNDIAGSTARDEIAIDNITINLSYKTIISVFPFTETFEVSSTTLAAWTQIQEQGTKSWTFATGAGGGLITTAYEGTVNARFTSSSGGPHATKLVTPLLDISGMAAPELNFWYGQDDWSGDQNELKVYYRTSLTNPWVELAYYTGNIATWTEVTMALPNQSSTYQLAFEGIDNYGYANVLDLVTVREQPMTTVDWCNLQWPNTAAVQTNTTFDVYARVYEVGVTDAVGQGAGIECWIGYSNTDTDPSTWTNWVAATYFGDADGLGVNDNDEYSYALSFPASGTYYYASRFRLDGGPFTYGGYNAAGGGFWDGTTNVSGVATVTSPMGADCANPFIVSVPADLTYNHSSTTCGLGNVYNLSATSYDNGEDAIYRLDVTSNTVVRITMTPSETWTGLFLFDGCPDVGTLITSVTNTGSTARVIERSLTAGTYYVMVDIWPTPDCFTYDLAIQALCPVPTAVAASNIATDAADLTWTAGGFESSWNLKVSTTSIDPTTGTGDIFDGVVNATPAQSLASLTEATNYYVYVQSSCGSAWTAEYMFTTLAACPIPTGLSSLVTGSSTATLSWDELGEAAWNIKISLTQLADPGSVTADIEDAITGGTGEYLATGLTGNTTYYWYVQSDCGSDWSAEGMFTTDCGVYTPDYTEDFTTYIPDCWLEADGPVTGPTTFGTSDWLADGFANAGSTGAARINLYYNNDREWLISPEFDLSLGGYELNFDVAVTTYSGTTAITMGSDDEVQLLYTLDGTTWINLETWNAANNPSNTGDNTTVDISILTGTNVQFAFWASDGTIDDTQDYNFYLDNFIVRTQPSCIEPTALISSAITSNSATISWTASASTPANGYEYYVSTSSTPAPDGATAATGTTLAGVVSVDLTSLTESTNYYIWVRSNCDGVDFSEWTGPLNFATIASCIVPSDLAESSITSTSAILSWTENNGSTNWTIKVSTTSIDPSVDPGFYSGTITTNPLVIPDGTLTPTTTYYWYIQTDCGAGSFSDWSAEGEFTTLCAPESIYPYIEPFNTYLPTVCWTEGDNGDLATGPAIVSQTASLWMADGFINSGSTGSAKINIYYNDKNDWLISPEFELPATPSLFAFYDVAATQWGATTAPTTPWEADDFVEFLIYAGGTWNILETYNSSNVPSHLGQNESFDLAAYAGQTVKFAFRAVEGSDNGSADIDFFVDNLAVRGLSDENDILTFSLTNQSLTPVVIDEFNHTVAVEVLMGTDLTNLVPTFTISDFASVDFASGVARDFSSDVEYIVTSELGTPQTWTVTTTISTTQSSDKDILTFELDEEVAPATIGANTVDITVDFMADITDLIPTITVSPLATVSPASLESVDFTNPVTYTVTAEDATTKDYLVTVTKEATPLGAGCDNPIAYTDINDPEVITSINTISREAWFTVTLDDTYYNVEFSTCPSAYDTKLYVYDACGGTQLGYNDDAPFDFCTVDNNQSLIEMSSLAAGTYYVLVSTYDATTDISDPTTGLLVTGTNCMTPTNVDTDNLTPLTTDIVWTPITSETGWNIKVSTTDIDPTSADGDIVANAAVATIPLYSISSLVAETSYYVYVQANCGSGWIEYMFTTPSACPVPTGLTATVLGANDVTLTWDELGTTDWVIEVSTTQLTDPSTETGNILNNTPVIGAIGEYDLGGLTASTTYYWYVMSDCGSAWSAEGEFTTECQIYSLPYVEDFTSVAATQLPECWSETHTHWDVEETNNAGGTSPELVLNWSPSTTAEIKSYLPVIDATTNSDLAMTFSHFADWFSNSYDLRVDYTIDGGMTWNTAWSETSVSANIEQEEVFIDLGAFVDGETFQIAFVFDGYTWDIDGWYIDNINIFEMPQVDEIDINADVEDIAVCQGTDEATAIAALAPQITITDTDAVEHVVNLTWTIASYDANTPADYTATGTFTLPVGVVQTDPVTPLEVTALVTVEAPVDPTFSFATEYCLNSTADALPATSDNSFTGTWSPATIATDAAGAADYTFTPDAGQCASPVTIQVTVNDLPVVTCPADFEVTDITAVTLTGEAPAGGEYTGTGVTSGEFSADGLANGPYTLTYTYTDATTGCSNFCEFIVTVNIPYPAIAEIDVNNNVEDVAVCLGAVEADALALLASQITIEDEDANQYVVDVTWTIASFDGNTAADYTATGTFELPVTVSQTDPITPLEVTAIVTVNDLPVVTCPDNMAIASNAGVTTLTGATPAGGVYSGTNVTGDQFDPTGLALGAYTITYTYTDPTTGCVNSCDFTIDIVTNIINTDVAAIAIYPNPNNGIFTLNFSNVNGEVNYQIYDTKGSIIVDENIMTSGNTVKEVELNLVPGVYYVKLITNAQTVVEKLVIE